MTEPSIGAQLATPERVAPSLVVVGAATRDLDARDERGWRLGGSGPYAALCAARLGLCVRALIGVDAQAARASELDVLRAAGVELVLVPFEHGPVFDNRVRDGRREQVVLGASDLLPAGALPLDWRAPDGVLLGSVAAELSDEWATAFADRAIIALAWQGLLRDLQPGAPVRPRRLSASALVRRADLLFVSAEDIGAGGPPLVELLRDGQQLFVTHAAHGALQLAGGPAHQPARYLPPLPRRPASDATGAGDIFTAAYMAARLCAPQLAGTADEWRIGAIAAAAASLHATRGKLTEVPTLAEVRAELIRPRD